MRKYYKYLKIFLFIFVLIILIFCIIRAIHRWNIEQSNRTVELVLEYREVQSVAEVLEYDIDYLHDHESYAAKWLKNNIETNITLYTTDHNSARKLISQGDFNLHLILYRYFFKHKPITRGQ